MSSYFYRGRHRRPTHVARNMAALAVSGAVALPVSVAVATPAQADILDEIERCESGGKNIPEATGSSTASGFYQFLDSTWQSVTGLSGSAMDYSRATQRAAAEKLYSQQGGTPWVASSGCWGGGSGKVENRSGESSSVKATPRTKKQHKAKSSSSSHVKSSTSSSSSTVKRGKHWANAPADLHLRDKRGLGSFVCDAGHLGYDSCDPETLGQKVQFPLFDK